MRFLACFDGDCVSQLALVPIYGITILEDKKVWIDVNLLKNSKTLHPECVPAWGLITARLKPIYQYSHLISRDKFHDDPAQHY